MDQCTHIVGGSVLRSKALDYSEKKQYLSHKELQQEELRLLLAFDSLCKQHRLRYSLQAGTLLGAIRHKGFIPWDDDVDVSMPRPDYERLLSLSDAVPAPLSLVTPHNSAFPLPFAKIVTTSVRAQEEVAEGVLEECLWIDIFPMDGAFDSDDENAKVQARLNRYMRMSSWEAYGAYPRDSAIKKLIKTIARPFCKVLHAKSRMLDFADDVARSPGYERAECVCSFMGGAKIGWSLPKCGYEVMTTVELAGHEFPAMGCWEEYLTKVYGDYMQVPPEVDRVTHHLKAWRV